MRNVLTKGCFNLTKWNSSSPEFLNSIEPKIRLHPDKTLPQNQKVLGLPWNAALDCYVIESKFLQKIQITGNVAQRVLLKLAASLFDAPGVHCASYNSSTKSFTSHLEPCSKMRQTPLTRKHPGFQ